MVASAKSHSRVPRRFGAFAACLLVAAFLIGCANADEDSQAQRPNDAIVQPHPSIQPASKTETVLTDAKQWDKDKTDLEQWSKDKDKSDFAPGATALANESGGEVSYVEHPARDEPAILITPSAFADGETPLIVSLHGFGGNAAFQAAFIPLHERVNLDGFALLLPNGALDADGSRFWNPTDEYGGKSGGDDIAYLTELVAEARKTWRFGHIYFFGYSNGGFMAHHIGCKGLPGLRAVASLAGTSYVEESSCAAAPPVSALHVHGSEDSAILFEGARSETAFYLGAHEMAERWSRKTGCEWNPNAQPHSSADFDLSVPGAETQVFRPETGCADGISVELWVSEGSGHAPDYGAAFADALLDWLLAQD